MSTHKEVARDNLKADLERLIWAAKEAQNAIEYDSPGGLRSAFLDLGIWSKRAKTDVNTLLAFYERER